MRLASRRAFGRDAEPWIRDSWNQVCSDRVGSESVIFLGPLPVAASSTTESMALAEKNLDAQSG